MDLVALPEGRVLFTTPGRHRFDPPVPGARYRYLLIGGGCGGDVYQVARSEVYQWAVEVSVGGCPGHHSSGESWTSGIGGRCSRRFKGRINDEQKALFRWEALCTSSGGGMDIGDVKGIGQPGGWWQRAKPGAVYIEGPGLPAGGPASKTEEAYAQFLAAPEVEVEVLSGVLLFFEHLGFESGGLLDNMCRKASKILADEGGKSIHDAKLFPSSFLDELQLKTVPRRRAEKYLQALGDLPAGSHAAAQPPKHSGAAPASHASEPKVGMISARFNGGPAEQTLRAAHHIVAVDRGLPLRMVEAADGKSFGDLTLRYLVEVMDNEGLVFAGCTRNYGEKTKSEYSTHEELKMMSEYGLTVVPLIFERPYPPEPPAGPAHPYDKENDARAYIKKVFKPSVKAKDCTTISAEELADYMQERMMTV